MQSPEIDFRFAPKSGHSEAHAGLPILANNGLKPLHKFTNDQQHCDALGWDLSKAS